MGKGLGKSLITSFSFIILLMAAIIGISVRGLDMVQIQTTQIISDITPLNRASSNILISLLNEETGIHGYLVSGDNSFLESYELGKKQIESDFKAIDNDANNYPEIRNMVKQCKSNIIVIQHYFENEVSLVKSGKLIEAQNNMLIGKHLVDNFRNDHRKINLLIEKYTAKKLKSAALAKSDIVDILIGVSFVVFLLTLAIIAMIIQIITDDFKSGIELNMSLEKTIKDQEEFYANISHELKTPLNVILSTVQLLDLYVKNGKTLDSKNMSRYVGIMKQNCFRLSKLSNNLIDMSKIEAGYIELNPKNLDIVSSIEDITMSVVEYGKDKGVSLIFDTDVEEKVMAFDLDKIERIMLNLLSNAFKFTNPGDGILVTITDHDDKIAISVRDTGIGIPSDKLDFIFERFKQVDKSLTRNTEGSGIGLSLVKSLVTMHGGNITVNSEYGVFSEFVFELPVKLINEEKSIPHKSLENNSEKISVEFSDIYFK